MTFMMNPAFSNSRKNFASVFEDDMHITEAEQNIHPAKPISGNPFAKA